MERMNIYDMITESGMPCDCGREHLCAIEYLLIEKGAINHTAEMVKKLGSNNVLLVCDDNTYNAAGKKVCEILKNNNISHKLHIIPGTVLPDSVIPGPRIAPSEWEVGSVIMAMYPECDMILGVGSGVINDICKVAAFASGKKNAIIGTAPSMDGYASSSSAMEVKHVKMTLYNQYPCGIILDSEILAQAPMRMLWAGFGDMMAKYTAICEWKISNIINNEYYCDYVAEIMRTAIRKIRAQADKIKDRDPDAVQAIAEGLMLAGIAMTYAKVSRPASGLEHYFSHIWEMMALERNRPYDLHGIQVGIGTLLDIKLLEKLKLETPDREKALNTASAFDRSAWEFNVKRVFGKTSSEIISLEDRTHKNDPAKHAKRLDVIISNWDEIVSIIEKELPSYDDLYSCMESMGMPVKPTDIGVSDIDVLDALSGARDMRDKYTTSSLIWDLGLTEEYTEYLKTAL